MRHRGLHQFDAFQGDADLDGAPIAIRGSSSHEPQVFHRTKGLEDRRGMPANLPREIGALQCSLLIQPEEDGNRVLAFEETDNQRAA